MIVAGILLMKYTVSVTSYTGTVDFAQKYLQTPFAGTYSYWRLIGFGFVIIGVLAISGIVDTSYVSKLFGR
jgi:hypothetical protein